MSKRKNEYILFKDNCISFGFYLNKLENVSIEDNYHSIGLNDLLYGPYKECLFINYMFDIPWLLNTFPYLLEVPITILHGERDSNELINETNKYSNINVIKPNLPIAYGTHHSKMLIIFYETGVRIAIFTANFIKNDWNKKTQGIWTKDFPLKINNMKDTNTTTNNNTTGISFEKDLIQYVATMGSKMNYFCEKLKSYDFDNYANVILLSSVPGYHKNNDLYSFGHMKLRSLLSKFNLDKESSHSTDEMTDQLNPVICQYSSLGSLDDKWLFNEFCNSLMLNKQKTETKITSNVLHLIWPTVDVVRNSNEGYRAGGSICCPSKNMKYFLKDYLCKWDPPHYFKRNNSMPHIKTYVRYRRRKKNFYSDNKKQKIKDDAGDKSFTYDIIMDWVLLTSANLSKAAWGSLQKNNTQLMIRSYEIGVMFIPEFYKLKRNHSFFSCTPDHPNQYLSQHYENGTETYQKEIEKTYIFKPLTNIDHNNYKEENDNSQMILYFPLPYSFPPEKYNYPKDEPWVWDVQRKEPDIFGQTYGN